MLAEDPTVYQYDEIYDEMQSQRKDSKLARKDLDKKPKYISKLLETAERRKRENERRIEREVQKERELEGDLYKDKESFVTSAYRQKLEEMKALEEKERREDYLESIGDVRKQGDLSGFYRHLYAQQVNYEEEQEKREKREEKKDETVVRPEKNKGKEKEKKNPQLTRKYRKRESSESSDENMDKDAKLQHLPSNLDADSDFSIDSDSESESESKPKAENRVPESVPSTSRDNPAQVENIDIADIKIETEPSDKDPKKDSIKTEELPKKPKKDIWKKRTIGVIFDEAVKRFYERKANRTEPF